MSTTASNLFSQSFLKPSTTVLPAADKQAAEDATNVTVKPQTMINAKPLEPQGNKTVLGDEDFDDFLQQVVRKSW